MLVAVGALWLRPGSDGYAREPTVDQDRRCPHKPAIAILPFVNQSDDAAREYFADGLTQDIINALGRFSELTVMSWNAVLPYKARPASHARSLASLAVRYQVEGSVQQAGTVCAYRAARRYKRPGALVGPL